MFVVVVAADTVDGRTYAMQPHLAMIFVFLFRARPLARLSRSRFLVVPTYVRAYSPAGCAKARCTMFMCFE